VSIFFSIHHVEALLVAHALYWKHVRRLSSSFRHQTGANYNL